MLHHFNNYKDAVFKAHNTSIYLPINVKPSFRDLGEEPTTQSAGSETLSS
jgi:hypothetical protein